MDSDALVVSVVAGQSIKQLQTILGHTSRIVRTMPNTPAMIGEGTTVWAQSAEVTSVQHELTKQILGSFGVEAIDQLQINDGRGLCTETRSLLRFHAGVCRR